MSPPTPSSPWWRHPAAVLAAAWLAGSVPASWLVGRWAAGVDLRAVETGTVSGTALYRVAGFGPLVAGGLTDLLKGAVGPLLAGRHRPRLAAAAGGLAVAGHNWSPWLAGAGGRGISPALGALLVQHPPGVAVLAAGLAGGRLARQTGLGSFLADLALVPALRLTRGREGAAAGGAVLAPMVVKRLVGNRPPPSPRGRAYVHRLLFDSDPEVGAPGA